MCSQASPYLLTKSSHGEIYHILSFPPTPQPPSPNPYITTNITVITHQLFHVRKWNCGLFCGFQKHLSNSLIDSWEAGLLSCGAKLPCSQYIVLY